MSLKPGTRLGPYEVLSALGAGGMGEVYRARDHRLDRDIALKVLPDAVATDAARKKRFEREAKALAAANHPAIVTVHSIEEVDDRYLLTMELVEGDTVADTLPDDGFTLPELLDLGVGIAEGLAVAHERGVVHRDLKPGNIMVAADGGVKILDFGLARLRLDESASGQAVSTATLTDEGVAIGTPPYMSPEQLQGKAVDERSDIFSLGAVLYEMATGQRPFTGASAHEIASSVMRDQPALPSQLKPSLPRQFDRIIRHCLDKDPRRRFQTALDVANELRDLKTEAEQTVSIATRAQASTRRKATLAALIAVAVAAGGITLWRHFESTPDPPRERKPASDEADAPRLSQLAVEAGLEEWSAWSPDGDEVAYTAEVEGFKNLHLRHLRSGAVSRLTTADRDELQPTWGPGGGSLYFVRADELGVKLTPGDVLAWFARDGDIWRLDLATGEESLIVEGGFNPAVNATASRLAFDSVRGGPRRIWTTDLAGRNPRQVSTDESEFVAHVDPSWSPDGSKIVFRRTGGVQSDIYALDVGSGDVTPITNDGFLDMDPVWSPDGRWIYFSSYRGGGLNLWRVATGSEAYPDGVPLQVTTGAGHDVQAAVAPDSSSVVFTVLQQNTDLWRLPVDPESAVPTGAAEILVATTREDSRGAWSPDSTRIAFNSDRRGDMNLWLWEQNGERQITTGAGGDYQPTWSPDGEHLAFFSSRSGNADIWTVRLTDGELAQVTTSLGLEINPSWSPDGRWIAFQSDRDGRLEPWIARPDGSEQRRLAEVAATVHYMVWWPDSESVFFRSRRVGDRPILRVNLDGGEIQELPPVASGAHMTLSPDTSLILDVDAHKTLKAFPVDGSGPRDVFSFGNPASRIDYPRWSPDGRWILFDRADPKGADLWLLEGL